MGHRAWGIGHTSQRDRTAVAAREAYIYRNPAPEGYQSEIVVADNAAIRMLAFPEIEISFSEHFLPV